MTRYIHGTYEIIGPPYIAIEWRAAFAIDPGEPMVWRTANGDGYPGTPAHAVIDEPEVYEIQYANTIEDKNPVIREPRPIEKALAEALLGELIDTKSDDLQAEAFEIADGEVEP